MYEKKCRRRGYLSEKDRVKKRLWVAEYKAGNKRKYPYGKTVTERLKKKLSSREMNLASEAGILPVGEYLDRWLPPPLIVEGILAGQPYDKGIYGRGVVRTIKVTGSRYSTSWVEVTPVTTGYSYHMDIPSTVGYRSRHAVEEKERLAPPQ